MRPGLSLLVCAALVACRAQPPPCANSSYLHVVPNGGTAVAQYASVLRAHVAWKAEGTHGATEQLARALAAAGYTQHEHGARTLIHARHRLAISGVLQGATAPNATVVQHALRAASGSSNVMGVQVQALGTTGVRFVAVLEAQELSCVDMQLRLQTAERRGLPLATHAGVQHLELVMDAEALESGACTSVLELAEIVLNCTHAPRAPPVWTSAVANVTMQARRCERNATALVIASQTPTPPAGARLRLPVHRLGLQEQVNTPFSFGPKKNANSLSKVRALCIAGAKVCAHAKVCQKSLQTRTRAPGKPCVERRQPYPSCLLLRRFLSLADTLHQIVCGSLRRRMLVTQHALPPGQHTSPQLLSLKVLFLCKDELG